MTPIRQVMLALGLLAPAAYAQKAAEPPKAEAPKAPAQKADPKLFEEALKLYFGGKPKEAAPKLFAYVKGTPETDENHAWARLFLAKSLVDLRLFHAGAYHLTRIAHQRSDPQVLTRALEELKTLTDRPHDEVMIDEQVFGAIDLAFLPPDIGAFAHYRQGMIALKVGNERWANSHFARLPQDTPEASRAKFALLVTRLKSAAGKEASPKLIEEFKALGADEKLSREARNEAHLAEARLRYERKDYTGALEAYREVELPSLDPGRASLYLEEAWTRYQLGELHAAMGILNTLDAPTFRDEFLPDKYLLRAFIFRDLCHYLPAKRAAKELTRRFADSLETIRERNDLTTDRRLKRAALSRGAAKDASRFLETLSLEAEALGKYAGTFGDGLFQHLTKLYGLAHAEGVRVYDARLADAARVEADRLLRAAEQVRLMEYEVGLKLYERIKKTAKAPVVAQAPALGARQVAFPFDGEFWNDELRDYRFQLKSRCVAEEKP